MTHVVFGLEHYTGVLPILPGRKLYFALLEPHLLSGASHILHSSAAAFSALQRAQHLFAKRLLGLPSTASNVITHTELDIPSLAHRRLLQALRFAEYAWSEPADRLVKIAFSDDLSRFKSGVSSWLSDLNTALQALSPPCTLPAATALTPDSLRSACQAVRESSTAYIAKMLRDNEKLDLLHPRYELSPAGQRTYPVMQIRHYLSVPFPPHRRALTRLLCSCHNLAIETLRYRDGMHRVPREDRLCRICLDATEDPIHALGICRDATLTQLRTDFLCVLYHILPPTTFTLPFSDIFYACLAEPRAQSPLARFTWSVLQHYHSFPPYVPDDE